MSKKVAVIVAVIAVVVAAGGFAAAYSGGYFAPEEKGLTPVMDTVDSAQVYQEPENDNAPQDDDGGGTVIAEDAQPEQRQQPQQPANDTIFANNTIVINKPVYHNDTVVYQPVTIYLENYRTTINQHVKVDNDVVVIKDDVPAGKPAAADKSHNITVSAKRMQSDGWSAKFADDKVGMFVAIYDMEGKLVKTGFADENGLTAKGLENTLYFVYPADCADCNGSKDDIMFRQWEDESKDRPRLVPADSDVTASYRLVVAEKQQPQPEQPAETSPPAATTTAPPDETETAEAPEINLKAHNATHTYGWVQIDAPVVNKAEGHDKVSVRVYAPGGALYDSFDYSSRQGFFMDRKAGDGNYRIVAEYKYGQGTATAEILHAAKFAAPQYARLAATSDDNGAVRLFGLLTGGLAGEKVSIEIFDPDGQPVRSYEATFGTKPVFSLFIAGENASSVFMKTGNYIFAATHLPTGAKSEAVLFYDAGETETSATPVNVSNSSGRSERPQIAVEGGNVYAVWQEDGEIMFASSNDSGATFGEPANLSESEEGFATTPDIAVLDGNAYVVWADYNSDEQAAIAFRSSSDGGSTFGDIEVLGNYSGEGPHPQVVAAGNAVYVAWIFNASEEFTGDLMLAASSDGGATFNTTKIGENAANMAASGSGSGLHIAWQHYPSGDTTEEERVDMLASGSGLDLEVSEIDLQGMSIVAMSASEDGDIYVAGIADGDIIFAKGRSSSEGDFAAKSIARGDSPDMASSGNDIHVVWVDDGDVFLAASSDGGSTFGDPENISDNEPASHQPSIAVSEDIHVAWTDRGEGDPEILAAAL